MLNIPSSVKTLFQTDGIHKNFRVHFPNGEYADITNDNVVSESVKFTESLCSQSTFKFGLAEASVLEFETVGIGNMYGMTIEASIEIDCSSLSAADKAAIAAGTWDGTWDAVNEVFAVPYGVFRVESCPRNHGAMAHRQVTAYSHRLGYITEIPDLPLTIYNSSYLAKSDAIQAFYTGTGITALTDGTQGGLIHVQGHLYDSNGKDYLVFPVWNPSQPTGSLNKDSLKMGAVYKLYDGTTSANDDHCDFVEVTYDEENYANIGNKLIEKLDAQGAAYLYDADGNQVFSSNSEAVHTMLPWLFAPCISVGYSITAKTWPDLRTPAMVPVKSGKLYPILDTKTTYYSPAFAIDEAVNGESINTLGTTGLYTPQRSNYPTTQYNVYMAFYTPYPESTSFINLGRPTLGLITQVKRYQFDNNSPYIRVKSTGESKTPVFYCYDPYDTPVGTKKAFTLYNYTNSFDVSKMLNGGLEIMAKFLKRSRDSAWEYKQLDNSSPLSVVPENYEEMWWDEYDVSPIGTVTVTYQAPDANGTEQENGATITIGSGASAYDMSDNEVLKNLSDSSLANVTNILNTNFAPYADDVAFTPAELTMQGWPWIEAGDALEITAEDGTTVETYALRIEMSGIQRLTSVITAEGGEIIEEV